MAKGGKVILYTEQTTQQDLVTVPNVVGMSLSEANATLTNSGLNYTALGGTSEDSSATVRFQSAAEGTQLARGSTVTLTLVSGEVND